MTKEEIENMYATGTKVYNLVHHSFLVMEICALVYLYMAGYIEWYKGVLWAVAFVLLSAICMDLLASVETVVFHGAFLFVKIKLSQHMFEQIGWIIFSVVVMTLLNVLIKKILRIIIKKWGMYWKKPLGMG